jgi:hypothetical protein
MTKTHYSIYNIDKKKRKHIYKREWGWVAQGE